VSKPSPDELRDLVRDHFDRNKADLDGRQRN